MGEAVTGDGGRGGFSVEKNFQAGGFAGAIVGDGDVRPLAGGDFCLSGNGGGTTG